MAWAGIEHRADRWRSLRSTIGIAPQDVELAQHVHEIVFEDLKGIQSAKSLQTNTLADLTE